VKLPRIPDDPSAVGKIPEADLEMIDRLQAETFQYFVGEANPANGLIRDATRADSPSSIAVVGLGMTALAVGVERGLLAREEAAQRVSAALSFFHASPQGREADSTGYRGFYYHFLDMKTGRRTWDSELSTMDTALLVAGALSAAQYFDRDDPTEVMIRKTADAIYRRVDWNWALNRRATLSQGWRPETGFLPCSYKGYNEALLLYLLALGSPTHPIPAESYAAWTSSYSWKKVYGIEYLYAGPLFIHQLPQAWIDLREVQDDFMRKYQLDYFQNSRRATLVHQEYAIRNPKGFAHYSRACWGITASDGPGPATLVIDGVERHFYGYCGRGVPFGPDDGTISPWAVVTSLPFTPERVSETLRHFIHEIKLKDRQIYGLEASFNPTFPEKTLHEEGWVSPWILGLNEGPMVLMIENARNDFVWRLMRGCRYIADGLRRAGFRGGWL
jgi:hypothetical protein